MVMVMLMMILVGLGMRMGMVEMNDDADHLHCSDLGDLWSED